MTFFLFEIFKIPKIFRYFVPVPFCQLVRIWTLFLSICIDSKDLQSNFEVPVGCGSFIFPLPSTVLAQTSPNLRFCYIKRSPALSFIRRTLSSGNAVWLCRKKWLACNATHTAFAEKKVTSYKCHYLINSLVTFVFHF